MSSNFQVQTGHEKSNRNQVDIETGNQKSDQIRMLTGIKYQIKFIIKTQLIKNQIYFIL